MRKVSHKLRCYEMIKRNIINCAYMPGTVLTEDFLCGEFGISRTPIREALSRLEQERLLTVLPKKGIKISDLKVNDVNTIYETRVLVEPYCIRNYGYRVDQDVLHRIRDVYNEVTEQYTQEQQYELCNEDDRLHQALCEASQNPYLLQTMTHIRDQNARLRFMSGKLAHDRLMQTRQEHLDMIDAIVDKQYEKAAQVLLLHLERSKSTAFSLLLKNEDVSLSEFGPGGREAR